MNMWGDNLCSTNFAGVMTLEMCALLFCCLYVISQQRGHMFFKHALSSFIYKLLPVKLFQCLLTYLYKKHTRYPTSLSSLRSVFRLQPLDENSLIRAYISIQKYPLRLLLFSCKLLLFPTFFLLFHIRTSYFFPTFSSR